MMLLKLMYCYYTLRVQNYIYFYSKILSMGESGEMSHYTTKVSHTD